MFHAARFATNPTGTLERSEKNRPMKSRSRKLRELLESPQLEFLMEAHNGLSARIVEEAGFSGIWGSGLCLSAQYGVRDSNEASWTQVVDMLEFMVDATSVPILLDGDTGYGNFNNLRRLVRKLEQRGVAGVCIEDKLFPKNNSFIDSERQPLADIEEFCGKIRAGKDSQQDPDFCIVARVEALIAGWGLDEALRRAEAYREAGADAILIHSRSSKPDEILAFACQWENRLPLVIVPTKYYSTPTETFRQAGISVVIWANHILRASIKAMQLAAREIYKTQTLVRVEDRVTPLKEVFRLQGADELSQAEARYVPAAQAACSVVVLAATQGRGLESVTQNRPKAMLEVAGKPILGHLVDGLKSQGLHKIHVVVGYRSEAVDLPGIQLINNPAHAETGELGSLARASERFEPETVILYGDLLFRSYVLRDLLLQESEIVVVVDSSAREGNDLVTCSEPDDRSYFGKDVLLEAMDPNCSGLAQVDGRFIGLMKLKNRGVEWAQEVLLELERGANFSALGLPDLLNALIAKNYPVTVHYIHGHWMDVNSLQDLNRAEDFERGWSDALS